MSNHPKNELGLSYDAHDLRRDITIARDVARELADYLDSLIGDDMAGPVVVHAPFALGMSQTIARRVELSLAGARALAPVEFDRIMQVAA